MKIWDDFVLALKGRDAPPRPHLGRNWTAAMIGAPPFGEAPFSYPVAVRAAYERNAIAQRSVRIVAEGTGTVPLSASDPALTALVLASSAGQSLLETLAAHLLLHGNAYAQLIGSGDGSIEEIYALRPDRIAVEPDAQGWPAAYSYRAGEHVTRYPAQDEAGRATIVHIKAFHPTDDHYGLGCLGAAARAVAVHNAASDWNQAILDNAARPSGALVYDPGDGTVLTPEQFERLRSEMEASFAGTANAGRPMLLEGGLKWERMSLSPADMDFVALKAAAAREIALAFGVPPMLLGLPGDNTYANYREANRALWRLTILPLADKVLRALEQGLAAWWPDAALSVDLDRVPALAEDREKLWSQVSAADFLTRDEKRAMLGLE